MVQINRLKQYQDEQPTKDFTGNMFIIPVVFISGPEDIECDCPRCTALKEYLTDARNQQNNNEEFNNEESDNNEETEY